MPRLAQPDMAQPGPQAGGQVGLSDQQIQTVLAGQPKLPDWSKPAQPQAEPEPKAEAAGHTPGKEGDHGR